MTAGSMFVVAVATLLIACTDAPAPDYTYAFDVAVDRARDVESVASTTQSHRIVVPIYSTIATTDSSQAVPFAATFAVLNHHAAADVQVRRLDVVAEDGAVAHSFLGNEILLPPGARVRVSVTPRDNTVKPLAYFLVEWSGSEAPLVEGVMLGAAGTRGYALTSSGRSTP